MTVGTLQLYNTLTKRLEAVRVGDAQRITFYSCGPTVYDDAHIGNFRSFLAADVLRRWLESPLSRVLDTKGSVVSGAKRVHHVMNITDVGHMTDDDNADGGGDDKMVAAGKRLQEAKKSGKLPAGATLDTSDPRAIARFYEARFREDAEKLGLGVAIDASASEAARLRHMPRATEHVEGSLGMIGVIERLIAGGHAYVVGGQGQRVVYFKVQSFAQYGNLSGNTLDKLREGEGGRVSADNQAGKQHPADFLLWKEDATHVMQWESPWGRGYPGWHIECSAMSYALLCGERPAEAGGDALIDLHSGGEDNIFPHHECEIAQSCCAFSGARGTFARAWFHPRFLQVEGAKMSKSKGNFFTARDLFAMGHTPGALRLELIRTHYRSNANFTMQGLTDCARMIERWGRVRHASTAESAAPSGQSTQRVAAREELRAGFAQAMHEDLNIAKAIAAVNTFVGSCIAPTIDDAALLGEVDSVLGVLSLAKPASVQSEIGVWASGVSPEPRVEALLHERKAARAAKDFAKSDQIRDELARMGYAIKDMPAGKVEVRRA